MRRSFFVLAILCAGFPAARADVPFVPPGAHPPDYVVTMVQHAIHRSQEYTHVVSHHGGWTRVEKIEGTQHSTEFLAADKSVEVRIYGHGPTIDILRGGEEGFSDNQPRKTGERQTVLGESCTVWNVSRMSPASGSNLALLSCVTDDGIELWHRYVSGNGEMSSVRATRIERRPVKPEEVQPPRSLVALDWWSKDDPTSGPAMAAPEYESVLRFDNSDTARTLTTRRHRVWQWTEDILNGRRHSLGVRQWPYGLTFYLTTDESGAPKRLTLSKISAPQPGVPPSASREPKDLGRSETVLGERCRWFDMMPGMMDASLNACRTGDGIVLKEERSSRMARQVWTAIKLTRRPIALREVTPPAVLFDPKTWGIP